MLPITEQLPAVFLCFFDFFIILCTGCFTFNYNQSIAIFILDNYISLTTFSIASELPFRFKFNVLWTIAFVQQTTHTFKHNEILIVQKVTCRFIINNKTFVFRIY